MGEELDGDLFSLTACLSRHEEQPREGKSGGSAIDAHPKPPA